MTQPQDIQLFPSVSDLQSPLTMDVGYNFVTPYVLVYGTLRIDQGNYGKYLAKYARHMGTFRLKGFQLTGIRASYTGDENQSIVVDLFEIQPERLSNAAKTASTSYRYMYEVNYMLDSLEGIASAHGSSYQAVILPISNPSKEEGAADVLLCKFYQNTHITQTDKMNQTGDYVNPDEPLDYPILSIIQ